MPQGGYADWQNPVAIDQYWDSAPPEPVCDPNGGGLSFCGCGKNGRLSWMGAGKGEFVAETNYRYVGKGKGDCMPVDQKQRPPPPPDYTRQFGGFAAIAGLLALAGWVGWSIIKDTGADPRARPAVRAFAPAPAPAPLAVLKPSEQAAENQGVAEPQARAAELALEFDCEQDWDGTQKSAFDNWDPDKLAFCCKQHARGCVEKPKQSQKEHGIKEAGKHNTLTKKSA